MKLQICPCLVILNLFFFPLGAEPVLLARFDLAGMPLETPPAEGTPLSLVPDAFDQGPVLWQVYHNDRLLGFVPTRMTGYVEALLREGQAIRVVLSGHHLPARPGRFLQVEIWCTHRNQEEFPTWREAEEELPSLIAYPDDCE